MKLKSHCFVIICIISNLSLDAQQQIDTTLILDKYNQGWDLISYVPDSAIVLFNQVLENSEVINYKYGIGKAFNALGVAKREKGNYIGAYQNYKHAIEIRTDINDSSGLASTFDNLGVLFLDLGFYDSSLVSHQRGLKIRQRLNLDEQVARSYNSLGNFYETISKADTAYYFYRLCYDYYNSQQDTLYLTRAMNNLSTVFIDFNQYDSAEFYINKGITNAKYLEDDGLMAELLSNLTLVYKNTNQYDKAFQSIKKVIEIDQSSELYNYVAEDYYTLSTLWQVTARNDSALFYLNHALLILDTINGNSELTPDIYFKPTDLLRDIYKSKSEIFATTGKWDSAYDNFIKYYTRDTLINNLKSQYHLNFVETIFDSDKKSTLLTLKESEIKRESLGKRISLIISFSLLLLLIIGTVSFLQQKRINKKKSLLAQQQIESILSDQELKSINAMLEGQDNERKRIAEDLHDRVGSILSTVKLYFGSLNTKIDTYQDENKKQYDQANTLLDEAVQEVRRISHNLISGILMKFGLVPALKDLCDTVEGTQQLKINLKVFNVDERMDGQTEISIYRIIQELLSNVLKHAKATEVTISLTRNDGNLNIIIEDNGKGFDTNMNYEGIGLKNILSRVEKLNGQVKFDSVIDRGTTVIIDLPVDETPNEV